MKIQKSFEEDHETKDSDFLINNEKNITEKEYINYWEEDEENVMNEKIN